MIKPYMCIHCKKEFVKVPLIEPNECPTGFQHDIIKKTAIIHRRKADPFLREDQIPENEKTPQNTKNSF